MEIICKLFWMSEIFVIANILKRFEDEIEFETHCESTMAHQAHEEDILCSYCTFEVLTIRITLEC